MISSSSYVYFLTDDHGHIKIGKANEIYSRMCELQTGNPYKLRLLFSLQMRNEADAFTLEQLLHKKFQDYRMEGEWFEETPVLDMLEEEDIEIAHFKFKGRGIPLKRYEPAE